MRSDLQHIQNLINTSQRRLRIRELQAARYGIDCPPYITMEIQDLYKEIEELQQELEKTTGDTYPTPGISSDSIISNAWDARSEKDLKLIEFIDNLLAERHDVDLNEHNKMALRRFLLQELNQDINAQLVNLLSDKDQLTLNKMLDLGSSDEDIERFFWERIPNLEGEIAGVLVEFKNTYLNPTRKDRIKQNLYPQQENLLIRNINLKFYVFPFLMFVIILFLKGIEPAAVSAIALLLSIAINRFPHSDIVRIQAVKEVTSSKLGWGQITAYTFTYASIAFMILSAVFIFYKYQWIVGISFIIGLLAYFISAREN